MADADPITRLNAALEGRYRVERQLGEGGMATVYLADDLRHERKVALKVLKPELAAVVGAERFLAEIKTTANLQHPHILPLFDSGEADTFLFYVMPYVEGETLRDRLDREHQLPVDDAVQIAKNVAEALDYAHRQGVIHRDIKPANILLQAGKPVISDFGIALAVGVAGGGRLTETGLSLGTPHYMSPEQATGDLSVGATTDIYALGCVLYEMLVGDPPHVGSTAQAILGKIVMGDADPVTKHRKSVPANVDAAIHRALEKVPADRFSGAKEFSRALADPGFRHGEVSAAQVGGNRRPAGALALAGVLGAGTAWALLSIASPPVPIPPTHVPVATPPGVEVFDYKWQPNFAISPNGRKVVYVGSGPGLPLYLQDLDSPGDAQPIPGTEGAIGPFFSPDGEWIGFAADNALKKVSLAGGAPRQLANATVLRGGSWSPDGATIYYSPSSSAGVFSVSADGDDVVAVTTPEGDGFDNEHFGPDALPDGEGLLFTSCCSRPFVMHVNLVTGVVTPLVEGFYGRYVETGHLVYMQPGSLLAATFDPRSLEVGTPVEVASDVLDGNDYHAEFGISRTGSLAYLSGPSTYQRTLVSYDRSGARKQLHPVPRPFMMLVRFSPDGSRLAITVAEGQADILFLDLARGDLDPFVAHEANDFFPVWSRDGTRIAFTSVRNGPLDLFVAPTDRSEAPRLIHRSEDAEWPYSWSHDDQLLAFAQETLETGVDILAYSFDDESVSALRSEAYNEGAPDFSPDGRWLAYEADETGQYEVYVVPFPGPGPRCKVSATGGREPRWSGGGDELFYRNGRTAMVASTASISVCSTQPPRPEALFQGLEEEFWDVHPSGQLFVTLDPQPQPRIRLIQDWAQRLDALVGRDR